MYRPENLLLFYAAVNGYDEFISDRIFSLPVDKLDWQYLERTSRDLGVAGGLLSRLTGCHSLSEIRKTGILKTLQEAMYFEIAKTESMLRLYKETANLLSEKGLDFMPLKGCDPRISEGRGVINPMEDVDILIRKTDAGDVKNILEKSGYIYHGSFSDSHMNFFTDEEHPRFIEIHHDLVNRNNPIHSSLFQPSIESIWARSIPQDNGSLLSLEDLLSYLVSHSVKEYFHKPKWLADIVWVITSSFENQDYFSFINITQEWGTSSALGIVFEALQDIIVDEKIDALSRNLGVKKLGPVGKYIANRLICYEILRSLRSVIFFASAGSLYRTVMVSKGICLKYFYG